MNVELSLAALDTLWEDLRLGRVPFPLEIRSHGDTFEVRKRIKAAVYGDLARRGLAEERHVDDDLANALRLLAAPAVSVDLVALLDMGADEPVRAVAAARGRHGVLAVQRTLAVSVRTMRDNALAAAIVELLPHVRAGAGNSVTYPAAALREGRPRTVRAAPGGLLRTATPRSAVDSRLRAIAAITERPVLRAGQLGVNRADDSGRPLRLPGIAWFDTDEGRYATTVSPGPDGEDWITLWPADNARLAHRLAQIIAERVRTT
ncbi:ESX secretion-associated protein EspG [Actinophytocola xanthii]|uniref:ESX secretion-associated protein EspG n=1 Tax=Actinophytocola xanthii TaxID=1912961 RepID=A0A1Q8C2R7_9PSEU|nr:ESX secretion-associated protein EspG [Actinophytocola xanthii]OLF08634.1 hypothetical protein BU204_34040 [Actinophytocola xanthii]